MKLDDISSISKLENYLMSFKNLFHKDVYIQNLCQKAFHTITAAQFKQSLKSNQENQIEKQLQMEEQDLKDREKYITEQDKKRAKELRDSKMFVNLKQSKVEGNDIVNTGPYGLNENR
jgi:hypothetical protein